LPRVVVSFCLIATCALIWFEIISSILLDLGRAPSTVRQRRAKTTELGAGAAPKAQRLREADRQSDLLPSQNVLYCLCPDWIAIPTVQDWGVSRFCAHICLRRTAGMRPWGADAAVHGPNSPTALGLARSGHRCGCLDYPAERLACAQSGTRRQALHTLSNEREVRQSVRSREHASPATATKTWREGPVAQHRPDPGHHPRARLYLLDGPLARSRAV